LTPRERREAVAYLDDHGFGDDNRDLSNYELADLFDVSEKIIREDKKRILAEYTSVISPAEALSYVGQYLRSHDGLIVRAKHGLAKSKPGTQAHQHYLRLISDLEAKRIQILQEIGAVPKELGRLNVTEERWVATVSNDGIVTCQPASQAEDVKSLPPHEPEEVFDIQFTEVPSEES
jgi:hypothetical protein